MDDDAAVLVALVDFHRRIRLAERFHPLELIHDAVTAPQVLVDRHVEPLDHFLPMRHEVRAVLGVVLAGFRDEVAQPLHQLVPYGVRLEDLRVVHRLEQARVHIHAVLLDLQVERHVVDAGANKRHVFRVLADVPHDPVKGPLHAVAQPHRLHLAGAEDGLHVHAHRVGVVEEGGLWADFLHVPAQAAE